MSIEVIVGLLTNIILLMSLSVIYSLFSNNTKLSRFSSKLVMGISVGLVGFIVMSSAVEVEPGIFFDGRSILMLITGVFFGFIPSVIGGIILIFTRISLGGPGVIPGILWVILPAIFGNIWRYIRIKKENTDITKIGLLEQYLLLFITQVLMVSILFLFPNSVSYNAIRAVALPLAILYPVAGLAVSVFMLKQRINYFHALEIRDREKEYKDLFNKSASFSLLVNPIDGKIVNVNQAAINHYGYSFEEFTTMSIYDLNLHSYEEIQTMQIEAQRENRNYFNAKHILKNKEIMETEIRSVPIVIDGIDYNYATITDITDRLEQEREYQDVNIKLEATLHGVTEGIISTNEFGTIEVINDIAKRYLSVSNEAIGKRITDIVTLYSKDDDTSFKTLFDDIISKNGSFKSTKPYTLHNDVNDTTLYVDFSLSSIFYDNKVRGTILVFRDVTNQFEQNEQIQFISQHDYLTSLYNRYFLEVEMKRLDTKRQLPISIIHGDVNGLKLTNDAFGHIEGDKLIKEISNILKKATRSEDIIARWGGDEFIILLPQTSSDNAQKVISRIRDLQDKSMYETMRPSISLGLATKTEETEDLNNIFLEAETLMYNNKQTDGKRMRQDFLLNLQKRMENIHPDLGSHATQVSEICEEFGNFLNLSKDDIEELSLLGKYHDVGWANIPDYILLKTEELSEDEKELVQSHTEVGFRIMKSIPELANIAELILAHHERYNGEGYPNKIAGDDIPLLSRILTIVDAYDMMINNSVYTPKISKQEAIQELEKSKHTQLDPKLTDKFIEMLEHLN